VSVTDTELENLSSTVDDDDHTDTTQPSVPEADHPAATSARPPRRVSLSLRTVLVAVLIVLLAAAAGVFGWLYWGDQDKLNTLAHEASSRTHAEDIASDYAVNAADMDYQDFTTWKTKLVNGTSPELKDKLTKAADSMEQVLAPLQWQSTAKPLATKVRSEAGGIYTVDSFVSVFTKTMQAPDGLQSTATYSITIDSNNNWQITDVGGIDSALGK
jgi:Mce-associated membrane protein